MRLPREGLRGNRVGARKESKFLGNSLAPLVGEEEHEAPRSADYWSPLSQLGILREKPDSFYSRVETPETGRSCGWSPSIGRGSLGVCGGGMGEKRGEVAFQGLCFALRTK